MSSLMKSYPVLDLWAVDASELVDAGEVTPEHAWAVKQGYVSGFATDASHDVEHERVVAALKGEYSELLTVPLVEIRKVNPKDSLIWAASHWACHNTWGAGVLAGQMGDESCLVAVTKKECASFDAVPNDEMAEVGGSCHQYVVASLEGCTAFPIAKRPGRAGYCAMVVYCAQPKGSS